MRLAPRFARMSAMTAAVLAVRAVDADGQRIARAGQDRVGLRHRGDVEDVGARDHRLHGERHRAVPAFDDDGAPSRPPSRWRGRRRPPACSRRPLSATCDLAAQHAAGLVHQGGHGLDRLGDVLALGAGPPLSGKIAPTFTGSAARARNAGSARAVTAPSVACLRVNSMDRLLSCPLAGALGTVSGLVPCRVNPAGCDAAATRPATSPASRRCRCSHRSRPVGWRWC